ncbi:hypothetical protein CHU32_03210 [Superficieibacter electus]|uniref:Uncharacterized protein n=1 Tax=Superficieibacter electus TaxID=2022662 RepID=A0A2P5GV50_9ENTR|nr:hypothetical protein CHU33_13320 [Superficieibacter electus]POP50448.1 hypothetical protein CHU32_03210 [Superficieibacter electus]
MRAIRTTLQLYSTDEGGRRLPLLAARPFGCPLYFKDIEALAAYGWDCRIFVNLIGRDIYPGETIKDVEIAFLSADIVLPYLKTGTEFLLWEAGYIGRGIITQIP